jgi:hypothetical protein
LAGAARQPEERATRLGIPVGCAEADEGRNQIDLLAGSALGQRPVSDADLMIFSPSRSHCTAAPAMKIAPSSA